MKAFLKNKTISNSVITLVIRMIGVVTLFGLSFLMTNFLNVQWVGYYEFARVVLLTLATFCLIGTDQAILYFSGTLEAQGQLKNLKSIYYKMLFIVAVCSIALLSLYTIIPSFAWLYLGVKTDFLEVLSQCIYILPFYGFTILNTETIRAYNRIVLSEWFRNILKYVPVLLGVLAIMFFKIPESTLVSWYLYGFIFLALISYLTVVFLIHKNPVDEVSEKILTKKIVQTSYPMAISSFYTFLLMTIEVFLLGQSYGANYVAFYAIAVKIMSLLSMVIVTVNVNFAPKIAAFFVNKDWTSLQLNATKAAKFIALVNFVVGTVLLIAGPFILRLFGSEYIQALSAYYILIGTQIVVSTFGWSPIYLNMTQKQHLFHKIMGVAVLINLVANMILIPKYQMIGAAISYSITVLFWNICVVIMAKKTDNIQLSIWK